MRGARAAIAAQRGRYLHWAPVCLGTGVGVYFALPVEPGAPALIALALAAAGLVALARVGGDAGRPLAIGAALICAGLLLAAARSAMVAAPILGFTIHGPVEGRVVDIDSSASGKPRLTLDRVWIGDLATARTPARVRISLHAPGRIPAPGERVMTTAFLIPPPGPAEPGGFDFRRMAWFQGLGAVGYTRVPVVAVSDGPAGGPGAALTRARLDLAGAIRARMQGQAGAVAAAILSGDRSAISAETTESLRRANLSHLLAISGLHMGLLTGFVLWGVRAGLALAPPLVLTLPARKIAAAIALAAGAAYLALSGVAVATERAFVMVAVMLIAVLADRRAITLRAVAVAALILLIRRPESLTEAGFQMSFAATVALVAAFGGIRSTRLWPARAGPARWAVALVLSSAVAGAATAPFAAANFNRIAEYGLLANVLAMPAMGLVVMPAAVIAALAAPLGLAGAPLWVMGRGLEWILTVADRVGGMQGAVIAVPAPPVWVPGVMALGLLMAVLWLGRARLVGPVLAGLAVLAWAGSERPALLIADSGRLIGVMTGAGRALSRPEGESYTATRWLRNDGDGAPQPAAAQRAGITASTGWAEARVAGERFVALSGRGWQERVARACRAGWVILPYRLERAGAPPGCRLIAAERLRDDGAIAVWDEASGARLVSADARAGRRPWVK